MNPIRDRHWPSDLRIYEIKVDKDKYDCAVDAFRDILTQDKFDSVNGITASVGEAFDAYEIRIEYIECE